MPPRSSFQLKGFVELDKKLAKLRGPEMRKIFRIAIKEAGKPVLATAKQIVLVDSGRLRDSLTIKAMKRSQRLIGIVVVPGSREQLNISAKNKGFYPTAIELGARKQPANRFFRDAMLLEKDDSIRIISTRIADGIDKVAGAVA